MPFGLDRIVMPPTYSHYIYPRHIYTHIYAYCSSDSIFLRLIGLDMVHCGKLEKHPEKYGTLTTPTMVDASNMCTGFESFSTADTSQINGQNVRAQGRL